MYLLLGPNGSWRHWDVEELPQSALKEFGMPDSPVRVVRFHDGCFEHWCLDRWQGMASVEINGGVWAWVANCQRIAELEEESMFALLNGKA